MATTILSTLDFSRFREGSLTERENFIKDLLEAFVRFGFVKVINHGMFDCSKSFFDLPESLKLKAEHPPRPNPHRGWSRIGRERLAAVTGFQKGVVKPILIEDAKETFDIGLDKDPLVPNIWPDEDDLPGFQDFMNSYFQQCHKVYMGILHSLELGLGFPNGRLASLCCRNEMAELRLTHYPEIDVSSLRDGKKTRIAEHTDFGTITLLWQDSTGGLEVEDQRQLGVFIPVEGGNKSEMIVNIGDTLQWWSNNTVHAINHRVTIPVSMRARKTGKLAARTSIAFFGKANRDASLRCLPEFSRDRPAQFNEDITALEYNQRMTEKTY